MKDTIIKIGLISLSMLSLSACRQEPMIQLSEENKAKIEAKKIKNKLSRSINNRPQRVIQRKKQKLKKSSVLISLIGKH